MLAEKIVKIRLKTLTKLITAVALGGVGLIFPQNSISQGQTFLLWDGETVGTVFHYGGPTVSAYAGSAAFEGIPDQWHEPGIGLNNLPTWRQDISNYDEIWFYAKADAPGKTFDFSIYGWPYFSKKINIDPYIVGGGGLTTSYKQIRIPITLLKTNEYPLDRVEIFYFGTANPPASNHKIYIDNVYAVRFNQAPPPPNPEPLPPPLPQPIPIPPLPPPQLIPQPPPTQVFTGQFQTIIKAPNSSSLTVNWPDQSEASEFRVYLGPEPSADNINGVLPNQVLVATLPAGTTSYTIAKLAAGVDVFTHIEAITPTGTKFSNSYNKTLGGPRSKLDTALREVHLAAPNIIELVLENKSTGLNGLALIGNLGGLWQTGPWSIKRSDGADIAVAKIFRHSIPVSQPDYRVGFGLPYNENVVDVDHKIYLVLAEPIGQKEVLTITGPQNLAFILPFSDRYLETPAIQLNQVGYNPRASKRWAYVSGWLGDGGALKLADFPNMAHVLAESSNPLQTRQEVVRNLPITPRSILDADSGTQVKEINLSAVPASEDTAYRIHLPGVGVSWPTTISEKATREIFYTVARGLFHNRWAGDLKPSYTKWSRPQDHTTVFTAENTNLREFFPETTPKTGQRSLLGGYHDAGDFDQQLMHTVVPQALMRAFESNPAAFADNTLNIPESGNGIPDILDEALWGIAAWEQLQEADGGVRAGVESSRHPLGYYYAHQDQLQYWTYSTEPYHTARVAGLFAQAARLLAPYNSSRAEALKTRAIKAYFFSMAKGAPFNPSLLYAASELFALTRQLIYKSTFERVWSGMGVYGAFSNFSPYQFYLGDYFNNDRIMTDHLLGYLRQSSADAAIASLSQQWLNAYVEEATAGVLESSHAHRNPRPAGWSPDWGNGTAVGKYLDTIYAKLQLGGVDANQKQRYFDALSVAADYALGANPDGLVYFTGMGSRRVEEPLHLDSLSFIKDGLGAIPGIPVYGPVQSFPEAPYYHPIQAAFYPAFEQLPLMRRYADVKGAVVANEFSVWESQAPHVELFAILSNPLPAVGPAVPPIISPEPLPPPLLPPPAATTTSPVPAPTPIPQPPPPAASSPQAQSPGQNQTSLPSPRQTGGGGGGSGPPAPVILSAAKEPKLALGVNGQRIFTPATSKESTMALSDGFLLTRDLELGARGSDVKGLQELLSRDKKVYPEGLVTGFYGRLTRAAVIKFQKKHGLPPVGRVGPLTRQKLIEISRSELTPREQQINQLKEKIAQLQLMLLKLKLILIQEQLQKQLQK